MSEEIRNMDNMENAEDFDSMEWKLFELLEGNLNEVDKAQLLKEIANNPVLQQEWDLMQATVVAKPNLVFPGKDKLFRPEKKVIPLWSLSSQPVLRYAAILIGFALIAYPIYKWSTPSNSVDSLVNTVEESLLDSPSIEWKESPKNELMPSTDVIVSGELEERVEEVLANAKTDKSDFSSEKNRPIERVAQNFIEEDEAHNIKEVVVIEDLAKPKYRVESIASIESLSSNFSQLYERIATEYSVDVVEARPINQPQEMDYKESDYKGIRNTFNNTLYAMGAPLRNTKVMFKRTPEDNKPAIQIAYLGDKYQAMAMLELKR